MSKRDERRNLKETSSRDSESVIEEKDEKFQISDKSPVEI